MESKFGEGGRVGSTRNHSQNPSNTYTGRICTGTCTCVSGATRTHSVGARVSPPSRVIPWYSLFPGATTTKTVSQNASSTKLEEFRNSWVTKVWLSGICFLTTEVQTQRCQPLLLHPPTPLWQAPLPPNEIISSPLFSPLHFSLFFPSGSQTLKIKTFKNNCIYGRIRKVTMHVQRKAQAQKRHMKTSPLCLKLIPDTKITYNQKHPRWMLIIMCH